jgi:hypothetical protein
MYRHIPPAINSCRKKGKTCVSRLFCLPNVSAALTLLPPERKYIVESSLGYLPPLFCLSSILQPCRHICPNLPSLTCHRSATISHPNDFELQSDSRNSYFLKDLLQQILQTPDISSSSHRAVHTATSQIVPGGPAEGGSKGPTLLRVRRGAIVGQPLNDKPPPFTSPRHRNAPGQGYPTRC